MTMTSPLTFPYRKFSLGLGIGTLLPRGQVWTLLGQVQRVDLGWAGRMRCALNLSVGTLTVEGNRESIPLEAEPGDWLRIKTRRGYESSTNAFRVLSAVRTTPESTTAWLPTALHHRTAQMRRLRALLQDCSADLQLFFLLCMSDAQVQRGFFWRAAAADHDVYPGGLFDQSVRAAELAYRNGRPDCRDLAAITALLYDFGKALDSRLQPDAQRHRQRLAPHEITARRVQRALVTLGSAYPQRAQDLRELLGTSPLSAPLSQVAHVARCAVAQSWGAHL